MLYGRSNQAYDFTGWQNEAYKTIDFGSSPQEVSQEFYNYLTANATEQSSKDVSISGKYTFNNKISFIVGETIHFTIQGESYTAYKDDTWEEWINGIGNGQMTVYDQPFFVDGYGSDTVLGGAYAVKYNGTAVDASDKIIENATYTLEEYSGGGSSVSR